MLQFFKESSTFKPSAGASLLLNCMQSLDCDRVIKLSSLKFSLESDKHAYLKILVSSRKLTWIV